MKLTFPHFTLEVEYTYFPGTPDVMYLPNGDPGYPGDPAETEITSCVLIVTDKAGGPIPIDLEAIGFLEELGLYDYLYEKVQEDAEGNAESAREGYKITKAEARREAARELGWWTGRELP